MFVKFTLAYTVDMIQGVPTGLAFGSIPFLIQKKTSYTEIGLFSLASYVCIA